MDGATNKILVFRTHLCTNSPTPLHIIFSKNQSLSQGGTLEAFLRSIFEKFLNHFLASPIMNFTLIMNMYGLIFWI